VGGFAERMLDDGAREVYEAHPWSMTFGSFVLTTVDGTYAYSLPGTVTDFDGLPNEERITNYFAYDSHSLPIIPDSSQGQKYPVHYNRADGTFTFPYNPGSGSKTVYYRKEYGGLTTFETWPNKYERLVMERTKHLLLHNSVGQEARNKAVEFYNNSERLIKEAWFHDRKGQTLQETREPLGPLGDSIFYAFNGD
jgi:hypothetical protein